MPTLLEEGLLISDRYRIHELVGSGGSGWVYRATQEPIGRPVAVKVLRTDLPEEDQIHFEARFLREASLAGSLQHPHIVTIHDYGRAPEGFCFLVMEYLEGYTLREVLRKHQVPTKRIMRIFDGIAQGLRHAHGRGLVHRDVKPSNVFLVRGDGEEWRPKLTDFGLVREVHSEVTVTEVGTFLGTPQYIAPEQAMGQPADARSDVYSLGVVLYRALCGKLPYAATNPAALAYMHVHQPYPEMCERAPDVDVPSKLEGICRRCMKKEPAERYPDAGELLEDLRAVSRFVLGPDVLPPPDRSASRVAAVALGPGELPVPIEDELQDRLDTEEETDQGSQVTVTDHMDTPAPLPPRPSSESPLRRATLVPPDAPGEPTPAPRRQAEPEPEPRRRRVLLPMLALLALATVLLCGGLGAGLQLVLGGRVTQLTQLADLFSSGADKAPAVEPLEPLEPPAPEPASEPAVADVEAPEPDETPEPIEAEPVTIVPEPEPLAAVPPPPEPEPAATTSGRDAALDEVREALSADPEPAVAMVDEPEPEPVPAGGSGPELATASAGLGLAISSEGGEPVVAEPVAPSSAPSSGSTGLVVQPASGVTDPPPPDQAAAVTVDKVAFTAAEAQRTLDWVNTATERDLRNAGLYSLGVDNVLQQRPYASIEVFAATHYVGTSSVQAAKYAAHR